MKPWIAFRVNIGIMEKKMETNIVYWGLIGIMAKRSPQGKRGSHNLLDSDWSAF